MKGEIVWECREGNKNGRRVAQDFSESFWGEPRELEWLTGDTFRAKDGTRTFKLNYVFPHAPYNHDGCYITITEQ